MSQFYVPSSWGNSTWVTTTATSTITLPNTATIVYDHVPITPPPRTEVERLLAEVEAVCAMAR